MTAIDRKTILLVEDEMLIAHMEKTMLEKYGFRVLTERKGEKAVDLVNETPGIDLILMDINLGAGMSGTVAAEKILEKHDIPLIFLTSHSEPEFVSQAEMITSYGYIIKNSDETVLITSLRMAFKLYESKRREQERNFQLLESERNLAEAQRVAKLGHWKLDIPANTVIWSDEIYNIFEINKEEFRGFYESFLDYIHPEDKPQVLFVNKRARETGREFNLGYRIITKEGRIKYLQEKGYATQDEEGNVVGLFGTVQDISDREIMMGAYLDSEMRWKSLVENSPDFIGIYDKDGKVTYLNRYAEGFTEKDVIGISGFEFLPPESKELWSYYFSECLKNKKTEIFRSYGYGANMAKRVYENYFIYLSDRIAGPCVMGITKDVTEHVKIQESLAREIGEKEFLLKEVHHRIKNNFDAVEKILQIQSESLAEKSICRNILQDAIGRVESMRMIYEKLIKTEDYSTLSAKIYLEDLIGKILSLYPEKRAMRFEVNIDDIYLNSKQIFAIGIIANELVSNIMKYAFGGKNEGTVQIRLQKRDQYISFLIQDNGEGFREGFDPRHSEGLGMKFINILTKQLDGTCTFESDGGVRCRIEFEA